MDFYWTVRFPVEVNHRKESTFTRSIICSGRLQWFRSTRDFVMFYSVRYATLINPQ